MNGGPKSPRHETHLDGETVSQISEAKRMCEELVRGSFMVGGTRILVCL